ncbi:hypothetical protein COY27_04615 [Candidatus Woesearchaeota archaeon CG_4_10_14_0_2_um_filter_33_13]|nr:MAG: hypothetical protein COY27_04615 [Candidatus Woesearchaeota archaeon CG_4_10_14_0_2_um_filter_33_13]
MGTRFKPGWGNLFDCLVYSEQEEIQRARNNLATDIYFARLAIENSESFKQKTGKTEINSGQFQRFLEQKPQVNSFFHSDFARLASLPLQELEELVEEVKPNTLIQARLFTNSICEAECKECYTNKRLFPGQDDITALTLEESVEYLRQAKELGARVLYVAGRGEPLQDKKFLPLLRKVTDMGYESFFFTNGILLSNDVLARQVWGISCEEIIDFLVEIKANIYHKFWSLDKVKFTNMMNLTGRPFQQMNFVEEVLGGQKIHLPRGLALHLERGDINHIGVECRVGTDTYQEVKDVIIPWIEKTGVRSYVEPQITSGRGFNQCQLQCPPEQLADERIAKYLVRGDCRLTTYIATVMEEGTMSFCLSVESEKIKRYFDPTGELNIRDQTGIRDIYTIMHTHPFIVGNKYSWQGCRCQRINEEMRKDRK